jgi:hypothetical protein
MQSIVASEGELHGCGSVDGPPAVEIGIDAGWLVAAVARPPTSGGGDGPGRPMQDVRVVSSNDERRDERDNAI